MTTYHEQIHLEREMKRLIELIPTWKDEVRRKREMEWLKAYMLGAGFSYEQIISITDARTVAMVYTSMLYKLANPTF